MATALLAVVLAGCSGSDTSEGSDGEPDGDSPSSTSTSTTEPTDETDVPRPDVTADLEVTPGADDVVVSYSVTNDDDVPLLLVNRLPQTVGAGTSYVSSGVYVTGTDDGAVEVSQRVFPWPEGDVERVAAPAVGASVLRPREVVQVSVVVPTPFVDSQPFGDDLPAGVSAVPDSPEQVSFCLGVLPRGAGKAPDADGVVVLNHGDQVAEAQYLLCSDPVDLG